MPEEPTSRRPDLDGVRGVAILMVLGGHAIAGPVAAAGVTLFFGLSGYLITTLLLREYTASGGIRLGHFYMRRFTRLAPPLFFVVAVVAVMNRGLPWDSYIAPLTWTANYFRIFDFDVYLFGQTWSLGVEEQFYILWPLLLLAILRSKEPIRVLSWIVTAALLWRLALGATDHLVYAYHAAETAGSTILVGCLVALTGWQVRSNLAVLGSVAGLVFVAVVARGSDAIGLLPYDQLTAWIAFLSTPLVAVIVAGSQYCPWLTWRWLGFFGVTSYSMYLWHEPISFLVSDGSWTPWGVALGAACGVCAYYVLERPVMRWRSRANARTTKHDAVNSG